MFCDRCGNPFAGGPRFCGSCGKPIQAMPAGPVTGRVDGHIRNLGIFWIVYSAFRLLGGVFFSAFLAHFPLFWEPHLPFFVPVLLRGIGTLAMAGGILGMLAGWGLTGRQPWARTLAIVLGFFSLFHFGIGTALGIYTLWVLLPAASAYEYGRTARMA